LTQSCAQSICCDASWRCSVRRDSIRGQTAGCGLRCSRERHFPKNCRTALPLPPNALDLSLNEVETLALKAARGAGLPWGLAEDAGRAAVWMARHVGAWATALLAVLEAPLEKSPLLLGGMLADYATAGGTRNAGRVIAPLWALPNLTVIDRPAVICLDALEIACNPGRTPTATASADALAALPEAVLRVAYSRSAPLPDLPHALAVQFHRSSVAMADWRHLDALVQRTYVPASERSRLTGAGAGVLDDE
jgi:hypothetical protein